MNLTNKLIKLNSESVECAFASISLPSLLTHKSGCMLKNSKFCLLNVFKILLEPIFIDLGNGI